MDYPMIDIHRHSSRVENADLVIRNLFHNQSSELKNCLYCTVGLHPWHVNKETLETDLLLVRKMSRYKQVIAIGETGIDKAVDISFEVQLKAFEEQLSLAKELNKPMIIHCVRAYNEILSMRKHTKHKQPWIFHWFNAGPEVGLKLIRKGCYLSFGHMLFKENSKALKAFKEIPLTHVFLETDDANVTIDKVYQRAAELRNISPRALQKQIRVNFTTCFGIEL